ncbi:MAG: hypothetical protein K1X92_13745 [Bacteroidia bacterium]|nr:hypothetical protein [Bacteroidia bacterium]
MIKTDFLYSNASISVRKKRLAGRWILLFLFFPFLPVEAQSVTAEANFGKDTFSLGLMMPLTITIRHTDTIPVVFPDESGNFSPFVFVKKTFFPTVTHKNISEDKAIYYLQCFDLQHKVTLPLKCHYVQKGDTIPLNFESNTLTLNERIAAFDSVSLLKYKIQKGIIIMNDPINPYILIGAFILAVFLFVMMFLFLRKPVTNYLKRQFIRREWYNIRRQLQRLQGQTQNQPVYFDELNKIWKEVVGKDQPVSLRSLTTSELLPVLQGISDLSSEQIETLYNTSQMADKVIYAGIPLKKNELSVVSETIKQLLENLYMNKIKKI